MWMGHGNSQAEWLITVHTRTLPDVFLSLVGDFLIVVKLVRSEAGAGLLDAGHVVVPISAHFRVSPVNGPSEVGRLEDIERHVL